MTHILANEMRGKNINVNAIAPGPTATHLFLDGMQGLVPIRDRRASRRSFRQSDSSASTVTRDGGCATQAAAACTLFHPQGK